MNNKNRVQSVNQPNKKSKANETNVQANAQCYFDFIECQREIGARCIGQWVRLFKMFSIRCCCCIFFACIYVLDWIELSVLFAVWSEWNITAIRLIRFSYFALDFSTGCRFQLQCPYNSFVKNRRRFWLLLLFCIKDVKKRARTRLIRLSNWPHL